MVKIMMHGCNGVMGQVISKIVEEHYFAEGKKLTGAEKKEDTDPDGFMHLPDGEELPFE